MMFSNKFVMSLLLNGQVVQEKANGEVELPFGSTFQVRLRNKNDRCAIVKLFMDSERMCRGGFVIPANAYRDIDCSSVTLKKFLFADLQSLAAQDFGKDQQNLNKTMGLIEAHFHLEKVKPIVHEVHHYLPQPHYLHPYKQPSHWWHTGYGALESAENVDSNSCTDFDGLESKTLSDGCVVEGALSNQRFGEMNVDYEQDNATVLKLYLRGYKEENKVVETLISTPNTKVGHCKFCSNCGTRVTELSIYCSNCGNKFV